MLSSVEKGRLIGYKCRDLILVFLDFQERSEVFLICVRADDGEVEGIGLENVLSNALDVGGRNFMYAFDYFFE
jgi:hypothetical protein